MKKLLWYVFGLGALMLALVAVGAMPPVQASSGTKIDAIGQAGPYAIGFTSYVLTDNSRPAPDGYPAGGRPIPVYLWYPADPEAVAASPRAQYPVDLLLGPPGLKFSSLEWEAMGYDPAFQEPPVSAKGPFPVLMVSHGMQVPAWFMTGIATRLASHGFVVAAPYHAGDAGWFDWQPVAGDHITLQMWNRPRDISFVLTDLEQRNAAAGGLLTGAIDASRVAATGWSAGGYAADVLVCGDDTVWDYGVSWPFAIYFPPIPDNVPRSASLPDPRIKVIVTLSGASYLLRVEELARVSVPALGLNEEWDGNYNPLFAPWNSKDARAHAAYSGQPNYRVDITGTNHNSFADTCNALTIMASFGQTGPSWAPYQCVGVMPPAETRSILTRYMLAFLKTNLLGEPGYQPMLTPGWALTHETAVEFFETEKGKPAPADGEWPDYSFYFMHQPGIK